jgi:amino acid adenylation domain-containing protein/non-ribosomal peptide synthase protein (TIGR01720 family)
VRKAGFALDVRDVFERPTIAALGPRVRRASPAALAEPAGGGAVPLTPIQRWFVEAHRGEIRHFNQAVLLRPARPLDAGRVAAVLAALQARHDALRIAVRRGPAGFAAEVLPAGLPVRLDVEDLRGEPDPAGALARRLDGWHGEFDLERPPLFRAALVTVSDGQRLWLAAHHLVVDGVSWRILLEDLAVGYRQAERDEPIDFGPPTATYRAWAEETAGAARDPELRAEIAYWLEVERSAPGLPAPARPGDDVHRYGEAETAHATLSAADTALLVGEAHRAYATETADLLLVALGRALAARESSRRTLVRLEGHGRERLSRDLDLTRTVGWFTSLFPFVLELPSDDLRSQIRGVKEQLRDVPRRGAGYGVLRYLTEALGPGPPPVPAISVNYLGHFDRAGGSDLFEFADESAGVPISPELGRPSARDLVCLVTGGRLRMTLTVPPGERAAAQALLDRVGEELAAVVAHCRDHEPERTPSDFASRAFTLAAYDTVLARRGWPASVVEDVARPTPMQESLLLESLVDRGSRAYRVQMTFTLRGALHPAAFERAWTEVARRHGVLRAALVHEDVARPVQVILRDRAPGFAWEDLRGLAPSEQDARVGDARERDLARGFDFEREPLLRFAGFRTAADRWRVVWSYHHVLLDGWSLGIALRDFGRAYAALRAGRPPALGPAPALVGLTRWLESRDRAGAVAFWGRRLEGYGAPAVLPGASSRAADAPDPRGFEVQLDEVTTARLRECAGRAGASLATIAQAAWALLLARYNRTEDVVFGTIVSGRPPDLEDAEERVGALINTVPVRVRPRPELTVEELVRQLQADVLAAAPHEHLPFAEILGASPLGRRLLTHLVIVENYPVDRQVAAAPLGEDLGIEEVEARDRTHYAFDLTLVPEERLRIRFQFDASTHDPARIERTAAHYLMALRAFAGDPGQRLGAIDVLPAAEREMVIRGFQPPAVATSGRTVVELIEARAAATPDRVAVEGEGRRLTYRQLEAQACRLAAVLRDAGGVRRGDVVALLQERSPDLVTATLAVLRAGAAFLPVDPRHPAARVGFMLEDADAGVVVADEASAHHLAAWRQVGRTETGLGVFVRSAASHRADDGRPPGLDDPAYVMYTSGSTGQPKGVVIPHRAVANQVEWVVRTFAVGPDDRFLQKTPVSFDPWIGEVLVPLAAGGCVVVARPGAHLDPEYLREAITRERITFLDLVPSQAAMIGAAGGLPADSTLRHLFVGGEAVSAGLLDGLCRDATFGVHNLYGPTETCIQATWWTWDGRPNGSVPIGRPVANTRIYVLGRDLAPVPLGVPGEICIAGANLARGYVRRPEATAAQFVEWAALPGERLYRTGDLGRWREDGCLEFLGREDAQVKIRGHRVEPAEVEAALRRHPAVQAVAVVAQSAGDGLELIAFAVAAPGLAGTPPAAELRAFLGAELPEGMVPSRFVWLARLPLTLGGKVDRLALVDGAVAADPAIAPAIAPAPGGAAPRDAPEAAIVAIWRDVLERERVGVDENFFDIGGHSLKAMQVVSRIRRDLGVRLTIRDFFAHPTVAAQAALVAPGLAAAGEDIAPAPPQETYAVSHAQGRLWLLHHLPGGDVAHNMPFAHEIEGAEIDVGALERACAALVDRHEALRTAFVVVDGEPRQRIQPRVDVKVRVLDMRDLPDAEARARELAEAEARTPFDLATPPLLRLVVVRMPGSSPRQLVLLTMHHIVGDGWSSIVLVRDLEAFYAAFQAGRPAALRALRIQYKDYSEWQSRRGLDDAEAWWLRTLADMPERISLPYDTPPGSGGDFRGAIEEAVLDAAVTAGLRTLAARRGMTPAHVLLAVFQLALYRLTGQADLCVGMSVANRPHPDLEELIGFFVNILPVRTRFSESMDFDGLLGQVAQAVTEALDHQEYPFDLLVRRLRPARVTTRQPLINVVFAFQNFSDVRIVTRAGSAAAGRPADAARVRSFDFAFGTSKFDLTLFVADEGEVLRLVLEYDTALFHAESARRHLGLIARFARTAADRARIESP